MTGSAPPILQRRGARRPADVPADVLVQLAAGLESANHMEQIAMDMGELLASQLPALAVHADLLTEGGLVTRMRAGGRLVWNELGPAAIEQCASSTSDTVRGWGAMAIGSAEGIELRERLELVRPFADDPHFAVREWAWLSLREPVTAELEEAIELLSYWTAQPSERIRRFASESTRPRGVWSTHIERLKRDPELGLPLLEPLRDDRARYVQDSVANWLNDASKSDPRWVEALCERWQRESPTPATERICRRAQRTLAAPTAD